MQLKRDKLVSALMVFELFSHSLISNETILGTVFPLGNGSALFELAENCRSLTLTSYVLFSNWCLCCYLKRKNNIILEFAQCVFVCAAHFDGGERKFGGKTLIYSKLARK